MAARTAALSSGAVTSAEGACLFSLPTMFTKRRRHLFVSFSPKSIRYYLRKFSPLPPVVAARASDWMAQQVSSKEEWAAVDDDSEWINGQGDYGEEGEDDVADFVASWDAGTRGDAEESHLNPRKETKLFVGNLPYDIDSEDLANLFEQAGVVEIAEVVYNSKTGKSRGFGFVTMSTVHGAEEALKKFNKYDLNGKLLTVETDDPRRSRAQRQSAPPFRMFVSNLPWQADDVELERLFSQHGKVLEARVGRDRESGRSRGFGFVTMSSEAELVDAIAALDGQRVEGRYLRVTLAVNKPRRKLF